MPAPRPSDLSYAARFADGLAGIAVALIFLLSVAGIVGKWASTHPRPARHGAWTCVVLPLRGGGGMVTDCLPIPIAERLKGCSYTAPFNGQVSIDCPARKAVTP